jgi:hypothetical protein
LLAASPSVAAECAPKPEDPVGYAVRSIGADQVQPPASTPPIAILDSGVSAVPELQGRVRSGANVVTGGSDTEDADGHGTAVAAIAAGAAGGVRGVAPTTPVIPITILNARGETGVDEVINGIDRAVRLGARVINISAAAPARGSDPAANAAVTDAIWRAVTDGVLMIAPTGNEGAGALDIPAVYSHVVAVAATDEANQHAYFSNSGDGTDLAAPGASIVTAAPTAVCSTGYQIVSGTSFAAPAVAGAAALLVQAHPTLDPTQLVDMLRLRGLRAPAPTWTPELGFGLLDIRGVLAAPTPAPDQPEVDDTVAWAKRHRLVMSARQKQRRLSGRLAPHVDPSDVFRVRLKAGDTVRLTTAGAHVTLTFQTTRATLARGKSIRQVVRRSGVYYVGVRQKNAPPQGVDYSLLLQRRARG